MAMSIWQPTSIQHTRVGIFQFPTPFSRHGGKILMPWVAQPQIVWFDRCNLCSTVSTITARCFSKIKEKKTVTVFDLNWNGLPARIANPVEANCPRHCFSGSLWVRTIEPTRCMGSTMIIVYNWCGHLCTCNIKFKKYIRRNSSRKPPYYY